MELEEINEVNTWNNYIERILSVKEDIWKIKPPQYVKCFNRIYGNNVETIWLSIDGNDFEIGVYPFAGAINFGVQINKKGYQSFWTETYTPLPIINSAYLSKNIRWTVTQIIEKVRKQIHQKK